MEELKISVSKELQLAVEEKAAELMGGDVIVTYAKLAMRTASDLLDLATNQQAQKATNLASNFAVLTVYENIVKRTLGIDEEAETMEAIQLYNSLDKQFKQIEQERKAAEEQAAVEKDSAKESTKSGEEKKKNDHPVMEKFEKGKK